MSLEKTMTTEELKNAILTEYTSDQIKYLMEHLIPLLTVKEISELLSKEYDTSIGFVALIEELATIHEIRLEKIKKESKERLDKLYGGDECSVYLVATTVISAASILTEVDHYLQLAIKHYEDKHVKSS